MSATGRYASAYTLITYVLGAGGRADTLPARYLDAAADAIVRGHPRYVPYPVRELLVTPGYRTSTHPQLRGLTLEELRRRYRQANRETYLLRRKREAEAAKAAAAAAAAAAQVTTVAHEPDPVVE